MSRETKSIILIAIVTLGLVTGFAFLLSVKGAKERTLVTTEIQRLDANPTYYDLGEVLIKGGIVTKEYEIKNTTGNDMELIKITTSCMCTTASVKAGDKETRFFTMEMGGDRNPFISLKVKKDETVKVTVRYDPAAHGPQGVGPFDRVVSLYFDKGLKELTFKGVVVN